MPLRSVEAATRDDAIAAAREQFGPSARVVGVRRVRSGGVLGFFATERYVAEVAPDVLSRPAVPAVARPASEDDAPADFSSPLASAAPARARATAPARNGAAAWAAEAARSTPSSPAPARITAPPVSSAPSWSAAPVHPAVATPARHPADDERVSELASLLAAKQAESEAPAYGRSTFPRVAAPRTSRETTSTPADDVPDAPSPFTAALARMVAGDRDVRQAVEEALVRPDDGSRPVPPARTAETSVSPSPARQEEETVGEQVIAPSSSGTLTVEVPTWAVEPEVTAPSGSPREEEIAQVLRSALAQGHSDEALAGILRKVLVGASPQSALTNPELPVQAPEQTVREDVVVVEPAPAVDVHVFTTPEVPVTEAPIVEVVAADPAPEPAVETPVLESPVLAAPEFEVVEVAEFEAPAFETYEDAGYETAAFDAQAPESATVDSPAHEVLAVGTPMFEVPVHENRPDARSVEPFGSATTSPSWATTPAWVASPTSMWDPPSMSATLWGEPARPAPASGTPIWAEVSAPSSAEPVGTALFEERVELPLFDDRVELPPVEVTDTAVVEEPVELVEEPIVEASAESLVESLPDETVVEAPVDEVAPVLARTASDPAPMMSFDSTSVMPPLSLLPPLPGSRGRGRPPVPPAPSRRSTSSSAAAPQAPAAEPAEPAGSSTDDVWAALVAPAEPAEPAQPSLATVTRLPVALPADEAEAADELVTTEAADAAPVVDSPAPVAPVSDRLVQLGVPRDLLGASFDEDVADRGTYAALTRALALRLPTAPELPTGAGEVLLVVGPGVETLRVAQSLAASLRLDPDRVQWATRGDLAGLAPASSRVTTVATATSRRDEATVAGTLTIVAVDAPLRADAYWTAQMTTAWSPVAVWAVVDATRKPEDLGPWIDGLPQVDALIVQDTDLSADPAAVLRRVDTPVALVDGSRATPHRWASLLCERLENPRP